MNGFRGTCFNCSPLGNLSILTAQATKPAPPSVSNAPRPRASAARLTPPVAPPLGMVPQAFAGAGKASSAPARGLTPADRAIVMPLRSLTAATQRRSDANEAFSGASFSISRPVELISCHEKWIPSTSKQVSGAAEPPASVVQASAPSESSKTTDAIALEAYAIHFRTHEIAFTPCAIHFRAAEFHFLAAATDFRTH